MSFLIKDDALLEKYNEIWKQSVNSRFEKFFILGLISSHPIE